MFNSKEESMEAWASLFGVCRFVRFTGSFMETKEVYFIFWRKNYGTEDNY